eukprot:jgi/Mesvir1/22571/Mv18575-RA.1
MDKLATPSWLYVPQRDGEGQDMVEDLIPTELNTRNCGNFLEVSCSKLSVRYTGSGNHGNDVGAIQANHPIPPKRLVYYFEITVRNVGERGCIAIGYTEAGFKLTRQPGWEPNSYGYHGDDGKKFHANGQGEPYGPTFGLNDVVGACLHLGTQEIFYTKNGKSLGVAFRDVRGSNLFPTVGLHSRGEQVDVNFGAEPFVFDIDAVIAEEHERKMRAVAQVRMPLDIPHRLVRSYLQHYGYLETLRALDAAYGNAAGVPGCNLTALEPDPDLAPLELDKDTPMANGVSEDDDDVTHAGGASGFGTELNGHMGQANGHNGAPSNAMTDGVDGALSPIGGGGYQSDGTQFVASTPVGGAGGGMTSSSHGAGYPPCLSLTPERLAATLNRAERVDSAHDGGAPASSNLVGGPLAKYPDGRDASGRATAAPQGNSAQGSFSPGVGRDGSSASAADGTSKPRRPLLERYPRAGSSSGGSGGGGSGDVDAYRISERRTLRQLVLSGDVDGASLMLRRLFPALWRPGSPARVALQCQKFIELARAGRVGDLVEHARKVLSRLRGAHPAVDASLAHVLAVAAYDDPGAEGSPVRHLLSLHQREAVADTINAAVLALGVQERMAQTVGGTGAAGASGTGPVQGAGEMESRDGGGADGATTMAGGDGKGRAGGGSPGGVNGACDGAGSATGKAMDCARDAQAGGVMPAGGTGGRGLRPGAREVTADGPGDGHAADSCGVAGHRDAGGGGSVGLGKEPHSGGWMRT